MNDKYIVFKVKDWEESRIVGEPAIPLDDAIVIRRQDVFAAPALYGYANAMAVAIELMPMGPERDSLLKVSDYFHSQAALAEQAEYRKLPD